MLIIQMKHFISMTEFLKTASLKSIICSYVHSPFPQQMHSLTFAESCRRRLHLKSDLAKRLLIEFVATALLIYLGLATEAQQLLNGWQSKTHLANALGWGLALLMAAQLGYRVSAHLNPAVSLVAFTFGQLSFCHFLLYSLVQTAGAYLGALLTYALYFDKIAEYDGGIRAVDGPTGTAGIFATFPGPHLSILGAIIDQISSTGLLCFCVAIITDKRNRIPMAAQPALLGAMLTAICAGFALNSGNAMNPARDLGPRLFTYFAGYGWEVFSYNDYNWFWVPIAGPFAGGLLGAWCYQLLVAPQLPADEDEEEEKKEKQLTMSEKGTDSSI